VPLRDGPPFVRSCSPPQLGQGHSASGPSLGLWRDSAPQLEQLTLQPCLSTSWAILLRFLKALSGSPGRCTGVFTLRIERTLSPTNAALSVGSGCSTTFRTTGSNSESKPIFFYSYRSSSGSPFGGSARKPVKAFGRDLRSVVPLGPRGGAPPGTVILPRGNARHKMWLARACNHYM